MTLTISPALDALAPLLLPPDLRLTPEQFELVCAENREAVLEPQEQAVEAWPASGAPQRLEQLQVLEPTPEFPGLSLQLLEIWAG